MNRSLTKKELRALYKEKRMALSQDEVNFLSEKIFQNFILQFNITENQKVNIFLPITRLKEINTWLFINYFFDKKIRVFVPRINNHKMISVEIFRDSEFTTNHWGIEEPVSDYTEDVDLDYVITPMLYCDPYGNRIGYGKGFYDAFFSDHWKIRNKIGINLFDPKEDIADVDATDVPLNGLITPSKYFGF